MPKIGLVDSTDDDVTDEDEMEDEELPANYRSPKLASPTLKLSSLPRQSVYVPEGVDPAAIKKAQYYFNISEQQYPDVTSSQAFEQNIGNSDFTELLTRSPLVSFKPNSNSYVSNLDRVFIEKEIERPPQEFINTYLRETRSFYSVDESPCLKILSEMRKRLGPSSIASQTHISTKPKRPVDYALSLGRSFRVGFSNSGKIVHCGMKWLEENNSSPDHGRCFRVVVEDIYQRVHINATGEASNQDLSPIKSCLEGMSGRHRTMLDEYGAYGHETIPQEYRIGGWQLPGLRSGNSLDRNFNESEYLQFIILLKDLLGILYDLDDKQNVRSPSWSLLKCIELVDACYGQETALIERLKIGVDQTSSFLTLCETGFGKNDIRWHRRREFISQWLELVVRTSEEITAIKSSDPYEEIFNLLALHFIDEATKVAESSGNFRIASIISQIGGDEEVKLVIRKQLEKWKELGLIKMTLGGIEEENSCSTAHISSSVINVYRTLCGDILESEFGDSLLNTKGMTWAQALGMMYWYRGNCEDKLSNSLNDFESLNHLVPCPYVRFTMPSNAISAIFILLKSFLCVDPSQNADFVAALRPEGYSRNFLDYQGPMVILALLESLGKISQRHLDPQVHGIIAVRNARAGCLVRQHAISQLLSQGSWAHATYLAIQIEDPILRSSAVRFILCTWAGQEGWESRTDDFDFKVCRALDIPEEWIHEAVAIKLGYLNQNSELKISYFKLAGKWKVVSEMTCQQLVPRYLLAMRDGANALVVMLEDIEQHLADSNCHVWNQGAGIVLEYLRMKKSNEDAFKCYKTGVVPNKIPDTQSVRDLLSKCSASEFKLWTSDAAKLDITLGHVCKHEMCTYLVKLLEYLSESVSTDTIEALLTSSVFPDHKLKVLNRAIAEMMRSVQ